MRSRLQQLRRRSTLAGGTALVAFALLAFAGCYTPRLALGRNAAFDKLETALQDGDVAVMTAARVDSCLLAALSNPPNSGPGYSHAELLVRNSSGDWMLAGVSASFLRQHPLREAVPGLLRLAIYRGRSSPQQRAGTADLLRKWLAGPERTRMTFDYAMQDVPGRQDRFYCVGLVNELYRRNQLPCPFAGLPCSFSRFSDHAGAVLGFRPADVPSASSVKANPDFILVAAWENPAFEANDHLAYDGFIRNLLRDYEDGWQIRPATGANLNTGVADLLWGIPEVGDTFIRFAGTLREYGSRVHATWDRMERRGTLEGLTSAEKETALRSICERYRADFCQLRPDFPDGLRHVASP